MVLELMSQEMVVEGEGEAMLAEQGSWNYPPCQD